MYYEKILKEFQKQKVKYLIAGGLAVNLYGIPRFTKDLDILIDLSETNLKNLKKSIQKLGFKPKVPVSLADFFNPANWSKWKKQKGLIALNLYHPKRPFEEIDLLVNTPLTYEKASQSAVHLKAGGIKIHLIGIKDLMRMKSKANRAQDRDDIIALKKLRKVR